MVVVKPLKFKYYWGKYKLSMVVLMTRLKKSKKTISKKNYDFSWYYMKNIIWGILFFCFIIFSWDDYKTPANHPFFIPIVLSAFLFPFAKHAIELFTLRFTTP